MPPSLGRRIYYSGDGHLHYALSVSKWAFEHVSTSVE